MAVSFVSSHSSPRARSPPQQAGLPFLSPGPLALCLPAAPGAPHCCPPSSGTGPRPRPVALGTPPGTPPAPPLRRRRTPSEPRRQVGARPPGGPLGGSAPHRPRAPSCGPGLAGRDRVSRRGRRAGCRFPARAFPGARFGVLVWGASALTRGWRLRSPRRLLCPSPRGFWNKPAVGVNPLLPTLEPKFSMLFFFFLVSSRRRDTG